jgi:hypothetical protein
MYYILNETNQVIAADDSLLNLCGVAHINELSSSIARGDTTFDFMSDVNVNITIEGEEETYSVSKTSLSSMLGTLTLVNLTVEDVLETSLPALSENDTDIEDVSSNLIESIINEEENLDSEPILDEKVEAPEDEEITFGDHLSLDLDDDVMELKSDTSIEESTDETESKLLDDSELFDLVTDTPTEDDAIETLAIADLEEETEEAPLALGLDDDLFLDTKKIEDTAEISINIEEISQKIGISTDDYNGFLNEFIDTSLGLEKDLQSNDEETRSSAIGTLSHLSDVLHLPVIGDIITNIADAKSDDQREVIESFYATLSRITTETPSEEKIEIEKNIEVNEDTDDLNVVEEEEKLELFDTPDTLKEPMIQEEVKPRKSTSSESFGTISLEGIKPKHFDFQLEEAANDLSLPVELIEEFVHDFIDQAHIETKKMLEAYEEGDLDAIQKIGHLLKGASSNLRINPLSDTLYKIQFCEDTSQLEALIKDYWAHFLSFENQINVISN